MRRRRVAIGRRIGREGRSRVDSEAEDFSNEVGAELIDQITGRYALLLKNCRE